MNSPTVAIIANPMAGNGRARKIAGAPGVWQNLTAEQAVFVLNRG